jgi:site-specific DNA recombinase
MLANDDLDRVGRGDEQLSKKLRKRAAIYVRVSSAAQEDNYSLRTQESACRDLAAARGWDVADVYSDMHTRVELWERPQLSALREAVRQRAVDAVICNAIDRLSGDPVHLGVILSEADHAG